MTTQKELNGLLCQIGTASGLPVTAEQAKESGAEKYLNLEYAACYGGYRLVRVNVSNGSHSGAFGGSSVETRLKASEMAAYLRGILSGLSFNPNN